MKMQGHNALSNDGLHRYQVQQHRGLIRSLELEYRYNLRQLEQQQRQFLRSRSKLTLGLFHCSSQGMTSKATYTPILPALKGTPSTSGEISSPRINQGASLEKTYGAKEEPQDPLIEGLCEAQTADKPWILEAEDRTTWESLTFADIKQRNAARMQALQPFMRFQNQLSSHQRFSGAGSPKRSRRYGFYSLQFSGKLSDMTHIYTGKK